ncbi:MAG TPA: Wzz/FepE/Etk N-terminal domain-containing protein [Candidatus Krumholzibacteria bacterium]|nr:Wzz/FepE/Etk N-terminal domain-containing protein [Candidatus Krumholzibacteria bacterium]
MDRSASRQETSVRDFLNVVFRRKRIILSIFVLSIVFVIVLDSRKPEVWESNSRVLVRRGEQASVLSQNIRTLGWEEEVASEIQVILSDDVFKRARVLFADSARARNLAADVVFNPGGARADVIGESNVFVIGYVDARKEVCQIGCDAVTLAFRDYYRERKAPPLLTDFFAGEIADVRNELDAWRQRRNDFLNEKKFFGADETSKFLLTKIGHMESRLSSLTGDISSQELRVANLKTLSEKSGTELEKELAFAASQNGLQTGIVQNIKFELQRLNGRREELSQMYTEQHPELAAVNQQIADLHTDLKQQVENAYSVERVSLNEMKAREASLSEELGAARQLLDAVPDQERELAQIDQMIRSLDEKHKLLVGRQSEAEIARAGYPEWDVSVLSAAGAPYKKKTRDFVRLALAPVLSIIIGLGIAFFLESMDHSVKSRAEAEEYLNAPVLATISERAGRKAAGGSR